MEDKTSMDYHFVIAGAGPAGLTAGITAARKGLRVIILEKGKIPGPRPRGEGVRPYSLLDDMLGDDFLKNRCFRMDGGAVYHSPGDRQQTRLISEVPLYFFKWRTFIDRLTETAEKLGVEIRCGSEVIEPVMDVDKICVGLKYRDEGENIREVRGNAILGCDGHKSRVGGYYKVPYSEMNCPMVKCMASHANIDISKTPDLQFYFIGNGDLEYAKGFPQCVAYGFPIGGRDMELGLMLRMTHAHTMKKTVKLPDAKTIMEVWEKLKSGYPGFSSYFSGAKIEHEEITGLSNARMIKDCVPGAGVVLIGDSAGFIDPFGSSGIYLGMAMANFWVNMLSEKMFELTGSKSTLEDNRELWSPGNVAKFKRAFKKTAEYKNIKRSYSLIGKFEWYAFKHLRTSRRINKRWKFLSWLLKIT